MYVLVQYYQFLLPVDIVVVLSCIKLTCFTKVMWYQMVGVDDSSQEVDSCSSLVACLE